MDRQKLIGTGIAVAALVAVGVAIYFLLYQKPQEKKQVRNQAPPRKQKQPSSMYMPDPVSQDNAQECEVSPVDIDSHVSDGMMEGAPLDAMSPNEALSMANADNAQWNSQNLLPNADLSLQHDGLMINAPTFDELSLYTPKLLDADVASRYFMEPPTVNGFSGSDVLRPMPMIGATAGSRESLVWGLSSIQASDLAQRNAAAQGVFSV